MTAASMAPDEAKNATECDPVFRDAFFELTPAALSEALQRQEFFHDMIIDGRRTGSWVYGERLPPNYHLWPCFQYLQELDLKGKRVLDIGTFDGMTAFVMSELGADRVDATCQFDLERFRVIRALRAYRNIAYYPRTDIDEISASFGRAQYDLIVISAMLHHLTGPLDALLRVRKLLRREGCFILESIFLDDDAPALLLNTELEDPIYGAPTLFVPTLKALRGMMHLAGFDILSETRLLGGRAARETNHERVTFLTRARRPSEIHGRSPKTVEVHGRSLTLSGVAFSELENDTAAASEIAFTGKQGARTLNIWLDEVAAPLQPQTRLAPENVATGLKAGRERHFLSLAAAHPTGAFAWDDIYLLGAHYPGETMPDGMTTGLKQFGNLHVLDYVHKLGLKRVLEVGPGFNLYFVHHLPHWCEYVGLDASGFYDEHIMALANRARPHASTIDALLGSSAEQIEDDTFEACVSVSVLEHVPLTDIEKVCVDMFRVLRPGGWALHSIDARLTKLPNVATRWLKPMRLAGFHIDNAGVDAAFGGDNQTPSDDPILQEPLSIRARFSQGYRRSIWGTPPPAAQRDSNATLLIAAQKPKT